MWLFFYPVKFQLVVCLLPHAVAQGMITRFQAISNWVLEAYWNVPQCIMSETKWCKNSPGLERSHDPTDSKVAQIWFQWGMFWSLAWNFKKITNVKKKSVKFKFWQKLTTKVSFTWLVSVTVIRGLKPTFRFHLRKHAAPWTSDHRNNRSCFPKCSQPTQLLISSDIDLKTAAFPRYFKNQLLRERRTGVLGQRWQKRPTLG